MYEIIDLSEITWLENSEETFKIKKTLLILGFRSYNDVGN